MTAQENSQVSQASETQESGAGEELVQAQSDESQGALPQESFEQDQNAGLADGEAAAEKIPQSEFDEMAELLESQDEDGDAESEEAGADALAAEAVYDSNKDSGSKIERAQDGSLSEKIKNSNEKYGPDASAAGSTAVSKELAPKGSDDGQNASVRLAPSSSAAAAAGKGASSGGADATKPSATSELSRVTNQGNAITDGPLVGPGSDKANLGRDATAAAGAASAVTASGAAGLASVPPVNEGIALAAPQKEPEEEAAPTEEKAEPLPSREMTIKNNQFVDVTYPGSGWIYLGEEDGGDHFIFQGRKLGTGDTTFTLRSKKPGTALLHFYKNDILTGNYIDDWIQITVGEKSAADAVHVKAPAYAEVVPPKFDLQKNKEQNQKAVAEAAAKKQAERQEKSEKAQAKAAPDASQDAAANVPAQKAESPGAPSLAQGTAAAKSDSPAEKVQTVIQTAGQEKADSKQKTAVAGTQAAPRAADKSAADKSQGAQGGQTASAANGGKAKDLLEQARKAYDEKRYEDALDLVQKFFDAATEDFDAGLYLEGLILEAKSSVRNIKSAIGAYDTLIKNWPQSQYWRKANERSIYLKRFYIDIR